MFILDSNICTDASFLAAVLFIKKLVKILSIIIPILLVLLLTIDLGKAIISSDEGEIKKAQKLAIKRIIYALTIFFVQIIVDASFNSLGERNVLGLSCYENANDDLLNDLVKLKNASNEEYEEILQKLIEEGKLTKEEAERKREELRSKTYSSGGSIGYYSNVTANQYSKANGYLGEATTGENGSRGNKAGDQTKHEVNISRFRKGGWKFAARFKSPQKAAILAKCMEDAAKNNNIGYDQGAKDRVSFYKEAKRLNWNIPGITKKVETTCSSVVSVCINAAGVNFPSKVYSDNGKMKREISKTGEFTIITDQSVIRSKSKLRRGDIVGTWGHTAVVL